MPCWHPSGVFIQIMMIRLTTLKTWICRPLDKHPWHTKVAAPRPAALGVLRAVHSASLRMDAAMARIDARRNQAPTGVAASSAARGAGALRADPERRAHAIPRSALSMPHGHAPMTTTGSTPSPPSPPAMSRPEFLAWLFDKPATTALRRTFKPVCSQPRLETGLFGHESASGLQRLLTNGKKGATLKGLNISQVHSMSSSVKRSPLAHGQSFRRCAVVGSSSNLLDRSDGAAIDAADWVIRVNNAPTPPSLHAQVGSRTDVYVNTHSTRRAACTATSSGNDQWHVTSSHCNTSNQVFYCHVPVVGKCWWGIHKDHFDRISPRLVSWARAALSTKRFPTSGFMAVLLALHTCSVTQLYGFGPSYSSGCAKYFGTCLPLQESYLHHTGSNAWHDMGTEYAWLALVTNNFTTRQIACGG